jgi:hypothetical protein
LGKKKRLPMLNPNSLAKEPEKSSLTIRLKLRRDDLTPLTRLKIASQATFFARYGTITRLAEQYDVSRPFIYEQKAKLQAHASNIFEAPKVAKPTDDLTTLAKILRLRLIGRCSLSSISELLSINKSECNSIGYISESLQRIGNQLGNEIAWSGQTVAATDELYFAGHQPILVTVDVASQAILKIELINDFSSSSWTNHLESLQKRGIQFLKIISDEGTVMAGGRSALAQSVTWQPDTFHAVSGRLGLFKSRLAKQKATVSAVRADRERLFWATKSAKIRAKALTQWEAASAEILKIEQLQAQFLFLYGCILQQFKLFRGTDATLRERSFAEMEVTCAIELLKTLEIKGLETELKAILNTLPNLFNFLDFAKDHLKAFDASIDPLAAPYWKRAWQAAKIAAKIKKNYPNQRLWKDYSQSDLDLLSDYYPNRDTFEDLKRSIFKELDWICSQASSPVENANSFLRLFINQSRDQIQQHSLNLLMFYYNHRILQRGKNKGFSPQQILVGTQKPSNWLELMLKMP